jgi:hypothetical protein
VVEQFPKMEGRQLVMVLSPKKGGKGPQRPTAKAASAPKAATAAPKTAGPSREEAPAEVAKK